MANCVPTGFCLLVAAVLVLDSSSVWNRAIGGVLLVGIGPLWQRMLMAPVRLTPTTFTYRRFWRYHSVPLADVVRAGVGPTEFGVLPWKALLVDTTSGPVTVSELASLGPLGRRSVAIAVDAISNASTEAHAAASNRS